MARGIIHAVPYGSASGQGGVSVGRAVDIHCDLGESFGAPMIGDDSAMTVGGDEIRLLGRWLS